MATRRPVSLFAAMVLILLALALWLLAVTGLGPNHGIILPGILALIPMAGLLAWVTARFVMRAWTSVRIVAGLLCLVGLAWPTALLVEHALDGWPPLIRLLLFLLPSGALIVAALLLAAGLTHHQAWRTAATDQSAEGRARRWRDGRTAAVCFMLSTLVVAKTLHNLYWLMVWDTTYDALGFLWLIPPMLAAPYAGVVLFGGLEGKARWAALYGLLVLALLVGIAARAERVSFRQLTTERAERVARALADFHGRQGRYPADLRQLTPWYMLTVPGPVIISGQNWCYQGGDDYYQLGYVDRDHWSSPDLMGRVYAAQGQTAQLPTLCEAEIAALQQPGPYFSGGWAWPFAGPVALATVQVGMRRAEVLERVREVWHRDGCAPRRPTGGVLTFTDLFWTGSRDVAQATVLAVHYAWNTDVRAWIVDSAEIAAQDQLYDRYGYCSTVDLGKLAGQMAP